MVTTYSEYKRLLKPYIAFKSISTDKQYKLEMKNTANWLQSLFREHGFTTKILQGSKTNPVVFAEYIVSKKAETVLIYGHYDVQPAQKSDGWTKDPFSLLELKGKLIARGVVDNKGQNLIHIVTILNLIKEGALAYNIKFLIEGNEETANPDMQALVKKYKKLLTSDTVVISDGEIVGKTPTLEASLRGGFNMKVLLTTAPNHLHSGLCGGGVPSASHELAILISKFFTQGNMVAIPGFYEGVDEVTKEQFINNKSISTNKELMRLFGVKSLLCENGYDFHTQTGLRPTLQITGMKTGYIDEGYCNIVPSNAEARINVRLVASQNPKKVFELVKKFIIKQTPSYTDVAIELDYLSDPIKLGIDSSKAQEVKLLLKKAYGKTPIIKYVGGGIPIVSDIKKTLGIDTLLISLGNDDCNMHGVNENFSIDLIKKGLQFSDSFFRK